ncbi:hypothetical protein STEG23_025393, partial [Scotinomys teguina]
LGEASASNEAKPVCVICNDVADSTYDGKHAAMSAFQTLNILFTTVHHTNFGIIIHENSRQQIIGFNRLKHNLILHTSPFKVPDDSPDFLYFLFVQVA